MTSTTSFKPSPTTTASPWRRIAAYFVDYLVFIVPLLGSLGLCGWVLWSFGITRSLDNPFVSQGFVILVLTLPIAKVAKKIKLEAARGGQRNPGQGQDPPPTIAPTPMPVAPNRPRCRS